METVGVQLPGTLTKPLPTSGCCRWCCRSSTPPPRWSTSPPTCCSPPPSPSGSWVSAGGRSVTSRSRHTRSTERLIVSYHTLWYTTRTLHGPAGRLFRLSNLPICLYVSICLSIYHLYLSISLKALRDSYLPPALFFINMYFHRGTSNCHGCLPYRQLSVVVMPYGLQS